MKKIYVMLPAYNESDNIIELLEKWEKQKEYLEEYELIINVINDCSTDDTPKKVKMMQEKYNNIYLINHEQNKGLSGGLNTGIDYFYKNADEKDLLVFMDADNTHDPQYIKEMVTKIKEEKDCVIASRYRNNSKVVGLSENRKIMSDMAKVYYSLVLKIPNVKDYTCGYRVYTYDIIKKMIKKYGTSPIIEKSFACMMELLYKVYKVGAKFDEVGFVLRYDNKKGTSKMKVVKTIDRSIVTALQLKKKEIFIKILLVLFAFFLSLGTNFSPTNNGIYGHDCLIFSYIGMAIRNGKPLYLGAWDNKGPLLYIIYAIGQMLAGNFGVYLIELLAIYISVLYTYKIIKLLVKNDYLSFFGTLYSFSIATITFEGGTFSENFALPFIIMQLYYTIKYFYNDFKNSKKEIFLIGFCVGIIALLRLNMLSIFLATFIVIIVILIKNKQWKEIIKWFKYGIMGFIISLLPSLIYLILNNALFECLNTAYFGAMNGFNNGGIKNRIKSVVVMLSSIGTYAPVTIIMISVVLISLILLITKKIKNKTWKATLWTIILSFIINVYSISLSGATNAHYCITFIPILALDFMVILNLIEMIKFKDFEEKEINIIIILVLFLLLIIPYMTYFKKITYKYNILIPEESNYNLIASYIKENTSDNQYVQMIGGYTESVGANYRTKRFSPTKYNYVPIGAPFTKERKHEIVEDLLKELYNSDTELIMICNENKKDFIELIDDKNKWNEFINKNYKEDTETIEGYTIFINKKLHHE